MSVPKQPAFSVLLRIIVALGIVSSCHRRVHIPESRIDVATDKAASQLLFGFYDVEQHSYRWTGRSFAVALAPPPNPKGGAVLLHARLFIADSEIKKLGVMSLAASVPGHLLKSKKITQGGIEEYAVSIPRNALCTNLLPVYFSFDRSLPPSPSDARDLGAVAISFALAAE